MHYFAAVVVPRRKSAKWAVEKLMAPYSEDASKDGKWDWWVMGGRWTGVWSDYDPAEDPRNWQPCFLCEGTGLRNDALGREHRQKNPDYTCNGCGFDREGTARPVGMNLKHAAKWVAHEGDVLPVAEALDKRVPHDLVTADGWFAKETWTGERVVQTENWDQVYRDRLAKYPGHFVAIVDYHI